MKLYKKSGCNECVHADRKYGYVNDKFVLIEQTCKNGNSHKLVEWWMNNGHKQENLDEMDCHEYHESTKTLIDMNDKLKELKDILIKISDK